MRQRRTSVGENLERAAEYLKSAGCTEIFVFGSVARGDDGDDSDLDPAVRGMPADQFFAVYGELMTRLSRPVDLDLQQRLGKQRLAGSALRRVAQDGHWYPIHNEIQNVFDELDFIKALLAKQAETYRDDVAIRAAALSLSTIYSGMGKTMLHVLKVQYGVRPEGPNWHAEPLDLEAQEPLLSDDAGSEWTNVSDNRYKAAPAQAHSGLAP